MKKFSSIIFIVILALSLVACQKEEPSKVSVTQGEQKGFSGSYTMSTGSATGNYYNFGTALCAVINDATGSNITVSATGGSIENVRLLMSGESEFAMMQTDVYNYAHQGIEIFQGTKLTNFKAITACYPEMVHIVVRRDSGIKSVLDLKGKKVNVGAVGSGNEVASRQILDAYGMTYDDIKVAHEDQASGKKGIKNGTLDAMFLCSGYPNPNVLELSLQKSIDIISIDQEQLDMLLQKYPYYSAYTAENDEYKLGYPITSVAIKSMLVCSDKFTDEQIYHLTKSIFENLEKVRAINPLANKMSLESALVGIPCQLHVGAKKYYEEMGLAIPDHLQ